MDQQLRNRLRRKVETLRGVLLESAEQQLESTFGILPDSGRVLDVDEVPPLQTSPELRRRRKEILEALEHLQGQVTGPDPRDRALEVFTLEAAFTQLNRLAALKLLERRDLVPSSISNGAGAGRFELFQKVAPEVTRVHDDGGYRLFLELLFDDLGQEIQLLFDRTLPTSHLFPPPRVLEEALGLLNDQEIEEVWDEDETLGWVYQYFTPKELREQIRQEGKSGPRNSYELAVRNQFYTPDYVVRFLADNTLGRLWCEIHPESSLRQREYLAFRPDEFREERREPRDPRTLRVLDPACGSGHFLHYCFDLLWTIYQEAYDGHVAGEKLRADFPDRDDFQRKLPALILTHNLYGIDIDLRAVQLAALSLYLRAKRAHPGTEIQQVNAVQAAPMPGERELFDEFLASLDSESHGELLKPLLQQIWEELDDLAAEAGSLLRAEQSIRERVEKLKGAVEREKQGRQLGMTELLGAEYEQAELAVELEAVPTEEFWAGLEARLVELLREYASRAESDGVTRRLFAEDAMQGMGFLDALMRSYDVVLMNPPFGDASKPSKDYIEDNYPRTKNDVYAAFVERGLELLREGGYLGAITSRTGFFLTSFQTWREEILLDEAEVVTFADLGQGVLDTAMVETAAYVLGNPSDTG